MAKAFTLFNVWMLAIEAHQLSFGFLRFHKTMPYFQFFGKKSACAKNPNLILVFWYVVRMRDFSLPLTVRSAQYVAGRPRVIPQKVMSHVTKNLNNTGERGASVYIGKKPVKNRRSFKKPHFGGGFFYLGLLQCLGVVA